MGVDFYACNNCGDTFPDCGDYTSCECGHNWCSDECAEAEGWRQEEEEFTPEGSRWSQETSCSYCRKEDFGDLALLDFCLELLGKTREEIILQYKNIR